jgi:hypothetical protein
MQSVSVRAAGLLFVKGSFEARLVECPGVKSSAYRHPEEQDGQDKSYS